MNCSEAEPFVSVLYDGEPVPAEAAAHVDGCTDCRARLRVYAGMTAEFRLMASRAPDAAAPPVLRARRNTAGLLTSRMLVPRFAVVLMVAGLVAASAGIVLLRAQVAPRPLWFQYGFVGLMDHLAQAGTAENFVIWTAGDRVGVHVVVSAVQEGRVRLGIAAHSLTPEAAADSRLALPQLASLPVRELTYSPGSRLEIPVEGGGTLVLEGQVVDHQPKIAWGMPGEPGPDQIVLTSPLVVSGGTLLANLEGANSLARDRNRGGRIYVPGTGEIVIALQQIPGAVRGSANWGNLKFTWQGRRYVIRTASPITGGVQPRTVWVTVDSDHPSLRGASWQLGTAPLAAQ